jgi:hypothetical protein
MEVAIPHNLGRDEVRSRLRARSHLIADGIPGGMAQVETAWPSDDRMTLDIAAMGQALNGHIDIQDSQVVLHMELPPALGFLKPIVEGAIRQQGHKLLAGPGES